MVLAAGAPTVGTSIAPTPVPFIAPATPSPTATTPTPTSTQPHQRPGAGHRPRWLIPRRRQRARTANPYGGIHLTVLGLIRADSTGAGMLAAPLAPVYVANGRYVTALA